MGRIDELLGLFKPEDRAKAESLLKALLDEVMGKVIGNNEPLMGAVTGNAFFEADQDTLISDRNRLRATQRQALQAIRDSVSGGK